MFGQEKDFINRIPKAQPLTFHKLLNWTSPKLKTCSQTSIKRLENKPQSERKYFPNIYMIKDLAFRIYK